jgi:hypothetical protein
MKLNPTYDQFIIVDLLPNKLQYIVQNILSKVKFWGKYTNKNIPLSTLATFEVFTAVKF